MTDVNVAAYGARGDGVTPATPGIQAAIDAAAGRGGGRVVLPPGRWVSGTLRLRRGITLELQTGATLLGSPHLEDYPPANEKRGDRHPHHLLIADDVEGITIGGGGTVDGNGPAFWDPAPGPREWIRPRAARVSPLVDLRRCRDVRLQDITIVNSPGWTVHLHECDRVWVRGVRLLNPLFGPNTDGFDINGCRDVLVSDCTIECGDDAVCLKSTRDARSCERVTVTNCIVRTHCAAFKIGSETHHDIRQVCFTNSLVHHSHRAFGIWCFDGGTVEDVLCANIVCDTNSGFLLNRPIHLDLRRRDPEGAEAAALFGHDPVDTVGRIRRVTVVNVAARTDGRVLLTAADGGRLEDISLHNVALSYPLIDDPASRAPRARSAQFSNHSPEARAARAAIVADGVDGLRLTGLDIRWPVGPPPVDWGDEVPAEAESWRMDRRRVAEAAACPPPFRAVWGRRLTRGLIDCPGVSASQAGLPPFDLDASAMDVCVRS